MFVPWVGGVVAGSEELFGDELRVVPEGENFGILVQVVGGSHRQAAYGNPQSLVLNPL